MYIDGGNVAHWIHYSMKYSSHHFVSLLSIINRTVRRILWLMFLLPSSSSLLFNKSSIQGHHTKWPSQHIRAIQTKTRVYCFVLLESFVLLFVHQCSSHRLDLMAILKNFSYFYFQLMNSTSCLKSVARAQECILSPHSIIKENTFIKIGHKIKPLDV